MESAHVSENNAEFHAVGIIGAGFAGLIAALNLLRAGRKDFVIFERADAIGGTWRDNVYPGCACDVPSYVYSIADEPNPNWSRMFSPQPEIWEYMRNIVAKHGLEKHIRYGADVVSARFMEASGQWELTDRAGRVVFVKAVIAALGPLNRPIFPKITGLGSFAGPALHTAEWDTQIDLRGKRVAIIGTGASAIQIIPAIAPIVSQLLVFQRSAAWIQPRKDHAISDGQRRRFTRMPGLQKLWRNIIYEFMELRGRMFIGNKLIHKMLTRLSLKKLEREVHDPETRRKLTPDYKLGCKRILSSDDYLPTFNRPNVSLITQHISEITPTGLVSADGQAFEADIMIYATGFEASEFTSDMQVHGLGQRELFSEWAQKGMEAHRGTTFSGFPNLAYLLGPNTGLGHSSVLHVMESQMPYILQYLDLLDAQGPNGYLEVKAEAQAAYNADLQAKFAGTVWASGCKSWYINSQGKNTTLYPRLTREFRKRMRQLDAGNYTLHRG